MKDNRVWYITPSCRPPQEADKCFQAWSDMGYTVMVLRQGPVLNKWLQVTTRNYLGFAYSVNLLVDRILRGSPGAKWFVHGGDDYYPDFKLKAGEIADQLEDQFSGSTFRVMQPTGDRADGGNIDTAAASAWMGREWCEEVYGGGGPMYPGYYHYYADTELQGLATKLEVFSQRQDIYQEHRHWSRIPDNQMPPHLVEPNRLVNVDKNLYDWRRANGFPGWETIQGRYSAA